MACPTLLIGGEKDLQCDPADVDRIRRLLPGPVDAHVVADLTHVLRLTAEAPTILDSHRLLREPVAPQVVDLIVSWLLPAQACPDRAPGDLPEGD